MGVSPSTTLPASSHYDRGHSYRVGDANSQEAYTQERNRHGLAVPKCLLFERQSIQVSEAGNALAPAIILYAVKLAALAHGLKQH